MKIIRYPSALLLSSSVVSFTCTFRISIQHCGSVLIEFEESLIRSVYLTAENAKKTQRSAERKSVPLCVSLRVSVVK